MIGKRWIIGCWIVAMGGCLMACAPQAVREAEDVVAQADSLIEDSVCIFSICQADTIVQLRLYGVNPHPIQTEQSDPNQSSGDDTNESPLVFDATNKLLYISGYPDDQVFTLYLYDNVGKYITSVNTFNPVDVRTLPSIVFYIEVMTDNQLVGAINLPLSVFSYLRSSFHAQTPCDSYPFVASIDDRISKWISVDPLADQYPGISPYAYCAWNPIKYIDPDGRDYTVNVDDESGTISIAAKYYVNQQSAPSAQQAADFWNNQSDKFAYLTKDRQYTIQFDLQVETVESPTQALLQDNSGDANAYALYAPSNSNTSGFTANGNQIVISPIYQSGETGAHEIGHSLGMEHSIYGIMTEAQDSPGRRPEATAQNIGQCISNVFRAYIYNTDAKGTINGSLNKHGRVIKIQ